MTYEAILKTLPEPAELRRRAILFSKIEEHLGENRASFTENFTGNGSDLYYWEDGSGTEAHIVFKADGEHDDSVLMFAYDHESSFNVYGDDKENQLAFKSIPNTLAPLLDEDKLKWDWDKDVDKIVYATVAAWKLHDSSEWSASPEFIEQSKKEGESGGFVYTFELFMRPLDEVRITKEYADLGYTEEALAEIKEVFHTYYA
jgi:hypothetical protein